jgi:hypothetical protein
MPRNHETLATALFRLACKIFYLLASPQMAVVLLATLAAVLAGASFLEANYGSEYSRWYVYESSWFFGLWALVAIHIFCTAASRFPWKLHHTGFVVTCAGLLVVMAGAARSFWGGVEGRVSLAEGETAEHMVLPRGGQIIAYWVGRPQDPPFEFHFDGGPVDWPAGKVLDIGEMDGVKARILGYYQHASPDEAWVADVSKLGSPAVRFKASGENGAQVAEGWLVDQQFGDAVAIGPIRLDLQRAASDRMLEDFLRPPGDDAGTKGRLIMYIGDTVERVSLDQYKGQKIPLGSTGIAVEITQYLLNARPDNLGNFTTQGELPRNPMVELRVHIPGQEQPLRQIAFAKDPLLNLDGVYPVVCPVKFRFDHPAIQRQTAIELLQTSDGKLFGRLCSAGRFTSPGELRPGDRIHLPANCQLEIVEHLPHARRKVTFTSDGETASRQERDKSEPAALVELTVGDSSEQVWLRRSDPAYGRSALAMPGGTMVLSYENRRMPLGFSLGLIGSRREVNPGGVGNAALSSSVRVVDSQRSFGQDRLISLNKPLRHGSFTVYQSGFDKAAHGREVSSFLVTCDPGRTWKYCGSLMIGLGIAIMVGRSALSFKNRSRASLPSSPLSGRATVDKVQPRGALRPAA